MHNRGTITQQFTCARCGAVVYSGYRIEVRHGAFVKWCEDCARRTTTVAHGILVWDNSLIPMINRDYSFLLSDIESVYSLVVSMISGADKQRFEQLYRRLPSPNQKLFLAQLFMPSCTARGTDNRLTYYRSSIQLLPGKTEISFQEKSEIELEMLYREYLCYLGDEGNEVRKQLRILANELLTLIMEKLQISVRPNVLNDIRLKVAI